MSCGVRKCYLEKCYVTGMYFVIMVISDGDEFTRSIAKILRALSFAAD